MTKYLEVRGESGTFLQGLFQKKNSKWSILIFVNFPNNQFSFFPHYFLQGSITALSVTPQICAWIKIQTETGCNFEERTGHVVNNLRKERELYF